MGKLNRSDILWLIDVVDQLCDEGKLTISEADRMCWNLLETPIT